jgi:hypothetical protein
MKNEIKVCKLVSGELIIGTFTTKSTAYDIVNPMHISFHQGEDQDQVGVGLIPYLPFLPKDATLSVEDKNVLMWVDDYPPVIKEQFITITSNIILPNLELPT